jgi:opine dehydrogenase
VANESTVETVAIIGAGIGGLYLVAELGMAGFKPRLHDIDDSKLSEIRARGGVDVEGEGAGFAAVERATSDLGSAVDGADVIIIAFGTTKRSGLDAYQLRKVMCEI